MKPDIVFFGEMLPERFYNLYQLDLSTCDLLIVMGTSLEVRIFLVLYFRNFFKGGKFKVSRNNVGQAKLDANDVRLDKYSKEGQECTPDLNWKYLELRFCPYICVGHYVGVVQLYF